MVVFGFLGLAFSQAKMTPSLMESTRKTASNEKTPIMITLTQQYDASGIEQRTAYLGRKERISYVVEELQRFSQSSQRDLLEFLSEAGESVSDIHPFWIFNGISCKATPAMIQALAQRPDIEVIDIDTEFQTNMARIEEGEDPSKGIQENIAKIKADQVWSYNGATGYTGAGVVVAILDSGIYYKHKDFTGNMWSDANHPKYGYNYVMGNNDPNDDKANGTGQGTQVAGVVAGNGTYNGTRTGVAPGAKLMAMKIANSLGNVTYTNTITAMQDAVDWGADIVVITACENGIGGRAAYRQAMESLLTAGVVAITPSGDNGQLSAVPFSISAPSNCPSPWHNPDETLNQGRSANICVGATDINDYKAYTSSIGPVTWAQGSYIGSFNDYPYTQGSTSAVGHIRPDLCAPGVKVRTTDNSITGTNASYTNYTYVTGSVISAAHVAGVAALLLEANPNLTPAQIDQILETSAVKCENLLAKNNYYGAGRVDALEAMNALKCTLAAPTGLTATAEANLVHLTWNPAAGATSYDIYCNENLVASGVTGNSYNYLTDFSGTHFYYMKSNAGNNQSAKSSTVYLFVDPAGPVVNGLTAQVEGENTVHLTWNPPVPNNELRYGNSNKTNYGTNTLYWAQRFTNDMLLDYASDRIDSLCVYIVKAGTYDFYLYKGTPNGPDQELFHQQVSISTTKAWYKLFVGSLPLDYTKDLWVVCKTSTEYAASYASYSDERGFQSLKSDDGKTWTIQDATRAWMIKLLLSNNASDYTYNIIRDTTEVLATGIDALTYTDLLVPDGVHYYTITTNYNNNQSVSLPCTPARANINTHFVVSFETGNNECTVEPLTQAVTNGPVILPEAYPSTMCQSEGFVFAGWCTEPVEYTDVQPNLLLAGSEFVPEDNMTLYAVYVNSEGVSGWFPTRHVNDGDQVCIVSEEYNVEFAGFNDIYYNGSSAGFTTNIGAIHPFTVEYDGQGYFLIDAEGQYLNNYGEGSISPEFEATDGCYWEIDFVDGYAFLRNTLEEVRYQLMAGMQNDEVMFTSVDFENGYNNSYKRLQLYRHIESGNTHYATSPDCAAIVADPVILPVSEEGDYFLNSVSVTMSTSTSNANITYTTDGNEPQSYDDLYVGPFNITATTTIKARAFKSGYTPSGTTTVTYQFPFSYNSITNFKNAMNSYAVCQINSTMTVVMQHGKYLYVCDNNGGLLVYDDYDMITSTFQEGDVINKLQGTFRMVNGQAMLLAHHNVTKSSTGTPANPTTLTLNTIQSNYYPTDARLVKIEQVQFDRSHDFTGVENDTLSFTQGNLKLILNDKFGLLDLAIDGDALYDIVGVLGKDGTTIMLYPRSNSDIQKYHTVTCETAENGTVNAPAVYTANNASVTLTVTPAAGYHLEDLYYYTTNPAEHTAIDQETLTFVMPDADVTVVAVFAIDVLYTVNFNPGTGICTTVFIDETAWHSGVTLPACSPTSGCAGLGYTFKGWADHIVTETMVRPQLFQPGTTYYPTAETTLYAVFAITGTDWSEVTQASDLIEGDYVITTKYSGNSKFYYLPHEGAKKTPTAKVFNNLSLAIIPNSILKNHLWTVSKINETQYSISYEDSGVTYYLKTYSTTTSNVQVSVYEPSNGWEFSQHATKGMLARFPSPEADPKATPTYLDISYYGNNSQWVSHNALGSGTDYKGELHFFLSPSSIYCTYPDCPMQVATPMFNNAPAPGDFIFDLDYEVEIICATDSTTIHYTLDGTTPNLESPIYTGAFIIDTTCTVSAIAYDPNFEPSLVATQAYTFGPRFNTIAAFKAAYNAQSSSPVSCITGDVQYVYQHGVNLYVCDETAGLLVKVYNNLMPANYQNGDTIRGGLIGTYSYENGQHMMILTKSPQAGIAGTPVEPMEIELADLSTTSYESIDARLVKVEMVTMGSDYNFSQTNSGYDIGENVLAMDLFNTVTLQGQAGDHYDITGFVGTSMFDRRIYPRYNNDFVPYYTVTCATGLENGSISADTWFRAGDTVTLTAHPNDGYSLGAWEVTFGSQPVTVNGNTFVMPAGNVNVTATFVPRTYTVEVVADPEEGGTVSIDHNAPFNYQESVTVTAVANEAFTFVEWRDETSHVSYDAIYTFNVTDDLRLIAVFQPSVIYNIYVNANPIEGGTVSGAGQHPSGEVLTVTATPNEGYVFVNWTEGTNVLTDSTEFTFTVSSDRTLVANFELIPATTVTQDFHLNSGWNWMSSYIEYNDTTLTYFQQQIALTATDAMIKSQSGFNSFNGTAWSGSLSTLMNENMYMISTDAAIDLNLEGNTVDPEAHPVILNSGWNWIGYLINEDLPLDEALSNLEAHEGDIIKGQSGFSSFDGTNWTGTLTTMNSGQGYIYNNTRTEADTLVFPTATGKGFVTSMPQVKYWTNNVHRYATNLSMMVTLDPTVYVLSDRYEIGAFVNGECRGSARLQATSKGYVAFLTVSSDNGDQVSFRLYDALADEVQGTAEESIVYAADAIIGSMNRPMTLHFSNTGMDEHDATVQIYPNPTTDKVTVVAANIGQVRVYNTLGQLLIDEVCDHADQVELDLSAFSAGVYHVTLTTGTTTFVQMIIKK